MHEMSIAQSILDIVDEYMSKENGQLLKEVAVEIGELVAVVPDSLTFCYDVLIEDTPYQNSKLKITIIPLNGTCSECNRSFKIKNYEFICPNCQSTHLQVQGGQELRISHLEVD
jgi:hydrogenase nickel incorporation protein HypA/HybF